MRRHHHTGVGLRRLSVVLLLIFNTNNHARLLRNPVLLLAITRSHDNRRFFRTTRNTTLFMNLVFVVRHMGTQLSCITIYIYSRVQVIKCDSCVRDSHLINTYGTTNLVYLPNVSFYTVLFINTFRLADRVSISNVLGGPVTYANVRKSNLPLASRTPTTSPSTTSDRRHRERYYDRGANNGFFNPRRVTSSYVIVQLPRPTKALGELCPPPVCF